MIEAIPAHLKKSAVANERRAVWDCGVVNQDIAVVQQLKRAPLRCHYLEFTSVPTQRIQPSAFGKGAGVNRRHAVGDGDRHQPGAIAKKRNGGPMEVYTVGEMINAANHAHCDLSTSGRGAAFCTPPPPPPIAVWVGGEERKRKNKEKESRSSMSDSSQCSPPWSMVGHVVGLAYLRRSAKRN